MGWLRPPNPPVGPPLTAEGRQALERLMIDRHYQRPWWILAIACPVLVGIVVMFFAAYHFRELPPPARGQEAIGKPFVASDPARPLQKTLQPRPKIVHRADCPWAKRIAPDNLVGWDRLQDATAAGYRPCKVCLPGPGGP